MNTTHPSLSLALEQLASLYQSEDLIENFFKVLQHKIKSEDLQWYIFGQIHLQQEKRNRLQTILTSYKKNMMLSGSEEIRGILQHALRLIHLFEDDEKAIIHALQLVHHHKLGVCRIIQAYFQAENLQAETQQLQLCILEEERALETLSHLDVVSLSERKKGWRSQFSPSQFRPSQFRPSQFRPSQISPPEEV